MINRINQYLSNEYKLDTLENISGDDDDNRITSKQLKAYNFDKIVGSKYKSCDALYIDKEGQCVTFIEFKNRTCICENKNERKCLRCDIRLKALESLLAFWELLLNANVISDLCEFSMIKKNLIVVYSYNKSKSSSHYNNIIKGRLEGNSYFIFDVDRYKKIVYNNVISLPDNEFEKLDLK